MQIRTLTATKVALSATGIIEVLRRIRFSTHTYAKVLKCVARGPTEVNCRASVAKTKLLRQRFLRSRIRELIGEGGKVRETTLASRKGGVS